MIEIIPDGVENPERVAPAQDPLAGWLIGVQSATAPPSLPAGRSLKPNEYL